MQSVFGKSTAQSYTHSASSKVRQEHFQLANSPHVVDLIIKYSSNMNAAGFSKGSASLVWVISKSLWHGL
jgi:hypothetical protein